MVRKSNYSKVALISAVGDAVQAFQDATDEIDEAVARVLRLIRTDLRCLSVLARQPDGATAGELAEASGLTRGAMTTALDRLEAAGYATRVWDRDDRRSVRVALTEAARRTIGSLYGPLAREGGTLLQKYTGKELAAVLRYLNDGAALQRAHAERIRAIPSAGATATPRRRRRRRTVAG